MGLFLYGFGMLGSVIASVALMRYPQKMSLAAYIIAFATIIFTAYFYSMSARAEKSKILAATGLLGFALVPILFVAYELAAMQISKYRVSDTMSCGLINVVCNFVGFVFALSLTPYLDKPTEESTRLVFFFLFLSLAMGLVFLTLGTVFGFSFDHIKVK